MIDGALPYLTCPVCRGTLARHDRALRCPLGHSFDMARQGYVDLSAGRLPHTGDSAEMIADRAGFLAAGHYRFIAEALAATTADHRDIHDQDQLGVRREPLILDAGTGTGDYLAHVLDACPTTLGVGLDVSKPALRRAARAHPRAAAVLADLWRPLPVADAAATVILNVFAPRNGSEFHRVLRPDGRLLVVTPAADHLRELVDEHGLLRVDPDKAARVSGSLDDHFRPVGATTHRHTMRLDAAAARTLIGMTPSARHVPVESLPTRDVTVTAAVVLTTYTRKP
ncbi:rRNA methyltransferase [Actinoplanes sp. SE50]|uniref:putative RNA methyltransferase n=1 Tax=unclassified Actinoplanes TaxID=2626549 RepID=UPI00023EDDC3|nr:MULTISPECIES: methyltransferase domain-containing protein [unclassified Actinoplanes]AEV88645.1 rRNA (guanine-N1-)-methyltransferase [Actinoplanes sp. SE50/110]ATO87049.1 rRNA methyltransferase [Actinoplanes sp. SE50]SLM04467.1 rRNA methyltransferase [Actinoplanes sp. SE50/110]